jgi:predicted alternative tryptophan synthase beta-subunit
MEMNYLDEAGVNYHALVAVLYALKRKGIDLDTVYDNVDQNIAGQEGIRPPPQDQEAVRRAIMQAINDIKR